MAVSMRTPPAGQIPFQPTSASGFISLGFISEEFKKAARGGGKLEGNVQKAGGDVDEPG